jgi:hypothetical protein
MMQLSRLLHKVNILRYLAADNRTTSGLHATFKFRELLRGREVIQRIINVMKQTFHAKCACFVA